MRLRSSNRQMFALLLKKICFSPFHSNNTRWWILSAPLVVYCKQKFWKGPAEGVSAALDGWYDFILFEQRFIVKRPALPEINCTSANARRNVKLGSLTFRENNQRRFITVIKATCLMNEEIVKRSCIHSSDNQMKCIGMCLIQLSSWWFNDDVVHSFCAYESSSEALSREEIELSGLLQVVKTETNILISHNQVWMCD